MSQIIARPLIAAAYLYLGGLAGWALLRAIWGDRWYWLFLLNLLALYLFVPVLPVLALGLWRRRDLLVGGGLALALAAYLYGGLFLPAGRSASAAGPILTVMSYNKLGFVDHPDQVVAAIRSSAVDIVGIQELNFSAAEAIQRELRHEYPYQQLDARAGVTGMGVISRYPLSQTGVVWDGSWIGAPQVLEADLPHAGRVTIVNIHPPSPALDLGGLERSVRERERTTQIVATFAADHPQPIVVLTDFNVTDQTATYAIMTGPLRDAWREAGWGFGHTWGHTVIPGARISVWFARIDYVFYSRHWRALSAHTGPWDGISDHRAVSATLVLNNQ